MKVADEPPEMGALDMGKALMLPSLKANAAMYRGMIADYEQQREKIDGMIAELKQHVDEAEREIAAIEAMNSSGNFGGGESS